MESGDENRGGRTKSTSSRGAPMVGVKVESQIGNNNRRALGEIKNLEVARPYPCAVIKKGLTDKTGLGDENSCIYAGRRPVTRMFAASLASNSQACHQDSSSTVEQIVSERQELTVPFSRSNSLSSCEDIDVDDCKSVDLPLPMVDDKQHMVGCELDEAEIEDLEEGPVVDIDTCDSDNPLAVVEYVKEIFIFYKKIEDSSCVDTDYMSNQFDINEKMRAILVDWLIEVHYRFELMEETLFLTVNIIDRFLACQKVVRKKLQLVGVTALLLASKYEEVSVPVVEDLIIIADRAYTREEVLEMERSIVNALHFNFSVPTPYVFMRRFLKVAAQSDKKLELLSSFIMELCLVEYEMLQFRPSLLAAAAVYTAQCTLKGSKHWTRTSEIHTGYSEDQLRECSEMMVDFHQRAGTGKLTGVHRKYNSFQLGHAAEFEPALFLLDKRS